MGGYQDEEVCRNHDAQAEEAAGGGAGGGGGWRLAEARLRR
jgi:hypothetical protein